MYYEEIKIMHLMLLAKLKASNMLAALPVDNSISHDIANKFFNTDCTGSHLFHLPAAKCFRFNVPAIIITMFASQATQGNLVINNDIIINDGSTPSLMMYGNNLRIINTVSSTVSLIISCKKI